MAITPYQPDFDTRWKELIKGLHKYVVQKFFPILFKRIDWEKGVRYLDKELAKIFADWIKQGKKLGDLLFEYYLKNGKKQLVLIHIEVQHGFDPLLPKRMFISYYRIRDRHPDTPLTALAIYTGPRASKNPGTYKEAFEGVNVTYNFNYLILKNLKATELLASNNPIDLALLAGLYVLKIKDDHQRALQYKLKLARLCLERGFGKQTTKDLIIFVAFTIALPKQEQKEFEKEIIKMTKMDNTPLIEVDRSSTLLLTQVFFGKTYEELQEEWKEEAMKMAKEEAMKMAKEEAMKMAKEEIEVQKRKSILHAFFEAHLSVDVISKVLDIDQRSVKKIISEAKKTNRKKTNGSNGTSKKG